MGEAFVGGLLIGSASLLFFALNGQLLGVSGILGGLAGSKAGDRAWRVAFIGGLISGGLCLTLLFTDPFRNELLRSPMAIMGAGLLVGLGTRMGGGCTSGHGICGMSRLSRRSIVATLVFMASGAVAVFAVRHWFGGSV